MEIHLLTQSVEETKEVGAVLAQVLNPGVVIVASGGLGAGKTALAQGLARGLGVKSRVTSPTFTLLAAHPTNGDRGIETLLHADLYRTHSGEEVDDLAIGELVESAAVCFVEWGDVAPEVLGRERILIMMKSGDQDDERTIVIKNESKLVESKLLVQVLKPWTL